jgi:chemotaxis protein methyltransferase CheR
MNRCSVKSILCDEKNIEISDDALESIRNILKIRKGFNLSLYKDKCIKRRMATRIRATQCANAEAYGKLLLRDEGELARLLEVLTIHVSEFFRNPPTYAKLSEEIFPYLFDLCRKEGKEHLKLWSVGCAGGEEPYSLALIMKDTFPEETARVNCSIYATDVSDAVLKVAAKGVYGSERLKSLPQLLKSRYFSCCDGYYQLLPEIMELVTFAQGDLYCTGSYPKSDMIMCRNVLIYFEQKQQAKIINGFVDALPSGGILVLGKSENLLGQTRKPFQTVCPVERIYRKI